MDQEQLKRALEDHARMMRTVELGDLVRGCTEQRGYITGWVTEIIPANEMISPRRAMVRIEGSNGSFRLWLDEVTIIQKGRR